MRVRRRRPSPRVLTVLMAEGECRAEEVNQLWPWPGLDPPSTPFDRSADSE